MQIDVEHHRSDVSLLGGCGMLWYSQLIVITHQVACPLSVDAHVTDLQAASSAGGGCVRNWPAVESCRGARTHGPQRLAAY